MLYNKNCRIAVTGVGVVSPIGVGKDAFWKNLIAGKSGIGFLKSVPSSRLPSKLGAEIHDFDPVEHIYNRKSINMMSRDAQLGVASANMSMKDAGLNPGQIDPDRLGVVFGSGHIASTPEELAGAAKGGKNLSPANQFERWGEERMRKIPPLWILRQMPNMAASFISIEHDARGPNNTITSRESSALLALSEAMGNIQRGAADCMIVGASSSATDPFDVARFNLFESLTRRQDDPERACRPFDRDRDGTVVGEGSATFVLERYEHAVARGADIYAELLAVGSGCDGATSNPKNSGMGLVAAIRSVVRRANIRPDEIGHINAHGKSTQRDDLVESSAYHRALGASASTIPLIALGSYFGQFDAGTGAVELAGSILAMRNRELPITLNYETPDPGCELNVVRDQTASLQNSLALSVNRTSMGQSAACLLRAV
ncbi:MAG: beta-ketoacyl-[acyl-carrier-protein] synthase family protein [Planctomycetaceae bacterium]|nr:beta-ketoacyl-[acyl-carrier-protein] synthase family protein [Planctomycetaceae bacterium]